MWREQNEALSPLRPSWADEVDWFLLSADFGMTDPQEVRLGMERLYIGLLAARDITDFGMLQTYLREKDADVQLSATPYDAHASPALICVDPVSGSSRDYEVKICQGREREHLLRYPLTEADVCLSHDVLEMILRHDTGIVIPGKNLKYSVQVSSED